MSSGSPDEKASKIEIFVACFGAGVAVNILIVVFLLLFIAEPGLIFFFHNHIYIIVFVLVFTLLWPIFKRKLKHSKYFPL